MGLGLEGRPERGEEVKNPSRCQEFSLVSQPMASNFTA
jgi:hypothetical protein